MMLRDLKQGTVFSILNDPTHTLVKTCCNNLYVIIDLSLTVPRRYKVHCYICHNKYEYYPTRLVKIVHTISI